MLNLIQADLFKWRNSPSTPLLLAIATASAAIMALFAYLIPQGGLEPRLAGVGFMFSDMNVISILGSMAAALLICGDFDNKTIQDAVANGSGRSAVVVGKMAMLGLAVAALLLPYIVTLGVAVGTGLEFGMESVAIGFLNALTAASGSALTAGEFGKLLLVALTLCVVYAAQLSICVPLAFALKKPVFVVALYYGLSIASAQLITLGESWPLFKRIFSLTPYGGRHVFLTLESGAGNIVRTLAVCAVFITTMTAVAALAFRKADIK